MGRNRRALLITLSALVLVVSSGPSTAVEVRHLQKSLPLEGLSELHLQTPIGEVSLVPSDDDRLEIELILSCTGSLYPCEETAEQVEFVMEARDPALVVSVEGPSRLEKPRLVFGEITSYRWWTWKDQANSKTRTYTLGTGGGWELSFELAVHYPKNKDLRLLLGEGSVRSTRLEGDAEIEIRQGSVHLTVARADAGTIALRTKLGRISLRNASGRNLAKKNPHREPQKVRWTEGEGPVDVTVRAASGNVTLQLR